MKIDPDHLLAAVDIAQLFGVTQAAVSNWHKRYKDFPAPVACVANGNTLLWLMPDVVAWWRERPGYEHAVRRAEALIQLDRGGEQ